MLDMSEEAHERAYKSRLGDEEEKDIDAYLSKKPECDWEIQFMRAMTLLLKSLNPHTFISPTAAGSILRYYSVHS